MGGHGGIGGLATRAAAMATAAEQQRSTQCAKGCCGGGTTGMGAAPLEQQSPPPLLLARGAAAAGCLITITSFPSLALRVQVTFVPPSPVHPHIYRCVLCCMLGGGGWGAEGVAGLGGVAT